MERWPWLLRVARLSLRARPHLRCLCRLLVEAVVRWRNGLRFAAMSRAAKTWLVRLWADGAGVCGILWLASCCGGMCDLAPGSRSVPCGGCGG